MKSLKHSVALVLPCSLLLCSSLSAWAQQDSGDVPPEVQAARQDTDLASPPVQEANQTPEQLQQLVAPIALYPDQLVAQILAAATYPTQVVEADRWLQQNRGLQGTRLAQAVDTQPWDPSVKALIQVPKVLANMDRNLSWTSQLGDAYINQQQDVMDAVQGLRQDAQQAGRLQTNAQQTVTDQGQTIVIEPVDPQVVYVPEYDPWAVYGVPLSPYPLWAPYPGLYIAGPGIEFGIGFGFGAFGGFGWGWNHWGVDWHRHNVQFDHRSFVSHSPTFFNHNNFNHNGSNRNGSDGNNFNHNSPNHNGSDGNNFNHNSPNHNGFDGNNFNHNSPNHNGFDGNNFNRGRPATGPTGGFHGGTAPGNPGVAFHRSPTANIPPDTRPSAFSSFNHGGVTNNNSLRGQTSFGGGVRGASPGGGFRGASPGGGFRGASPGTGGFRGGNPGGGGVRGGSPGGGGARGGGPGGGGSHGGRGGRG